MQTDGVSGGPDHAGLDSSSIFDGALVEDREAGVMEQWSIGVLITGRLDLASSQMRRILLRRSSGNL